MASTSSTYRYLFIFNIGQILAGVLALVLSLVQFSPAALDNASLIDFRYSNTVHILTGAVGLHMICKQFGSVLAKTLNCLSFVLATWTLCFYSDSLAQEASQFEQMRDIRRLDGGEELISDEVIRNHSAKLIVCALMIFASLVAAVLSAASFLVLERMHANQAHIVRLPMSSTTIIGSSSNRRRRQQMSCIALMKLSCSLATICLGAYLEALYKKKNSNDGFVKIGWHILSGAITFASGCIDLRALFGGGHRGGMNLLNLKISLIFSVSSAVLSLKTLDYIVSNYFVQDVREYSRYDELKLELQSAVDGTTAEQIQGDNGDKREALIKFVVHAAVVGSLALSFAHSVIAAVEASSYLEKTGNGRPKSSNSPKLSSSLDHHQANSRSAFASGVVPAPNFRYHGSLGYRGGGGNGIEDDESDELNVFVDYDENLHKHKSCSGILQCVCGLALISLCVVSLVSWEFSRGYDGGVGVLWLGCLFIASGLINANRPKTFTTSVYVLSIISSVLSFERAVYSFNVIYQAARNPRFQAELDDPSTQSSHTGRITLYAIEASIMLLEFLASTWLCLKFTRAIRDMPRAVFTQSRSAGVRAKGALCSLGFFHLLYAFVTVAVSIAAEIALWAYNVHVSYLVYSTNGVVVFAAVFVQWLASQHFQFLLASGVMNAVTASIGFFLTAPAMRDLYTLVAGYRSTYETAQMAAASARSASDLGGGGNSEMLEAELRAKPIQEWIIGVNALIVLLSLIEFVVSVLSGMICSYLLHHAYEQRANNGSTLRFPSLPAQFDGGGSRYWNRAAGGGGGLYGRAYSLSSSLHNLDQHNFVNPSSKIGGGDNHGFVASGVNEEYPYYPRRSVHSLNRVVCPTTTNTSAMQIGSTHQIYAPRKTSLGGGSLAHYGSLPSLLYGGNVYENSSRRNESSVIDRGGMYHNQYAYY